MTPTRIPAVRALATASAIRGSGRKSASSPWIRDTEQLSDLLLEGRLAQLPAFHLMVQLATVWIGRHEVAEALVGQAEAFTVGAQGGEEVGGDHAAEIEQQAFIVGHGSMQPLTGRLVRTGQDRGVAALGYGCKLLSEPANRWAPVRRRKLALELADAINADAMTKLGSER